MPGSKLCIHIYPDSSYRNHDLSGTIIIANKLVRVWYSTDVHIYHSEMGLVVIYSTYNLAVGVKHITSDVASLDLMLGHTFYNRPCLVTSMLVHTCIYIWLLSKKCTA